MPRKPSSRPRSYFYDDLAVPSNATYEQIEARMNILRLRPFPCSWSNLIFGTVERLQQIAANPSPRVQNDVKEQRKRIEKAWVNITLKAREEHQSDSHSDSQSDNSLISIRAVAGESPLRTNSTSSTNSTNREARRQRSHGDLLTPERRRRQATGGPSSRSNRGGPHLGEFVTSTPRNEMRAGSSALHPIILYPPDTSSQWAAEQQSPTSNIREPPSLRDFRTRVRRNEMVAGSSLSLPRIHSPYQTSNQQVAEQQQFRNELITRRVSSILPIMPTFLAPQGRPGAAVIPASANIDTQSALTQYQALLTQGRGITVERSGTVFQVVEDMRVEGLRQHHHADLAAAEGLNFYNLEGAGDAELGDIYRSLSDQINDIDIRLNNGVVGPTSQAREVIAENLRTRRSRIYVVWMDIGYVLHRRQHAALNNYESPSRRRPYGVPFIDRPE
ncbi:hypothetical protein B7494_g103 [Chlorociboria aeruginascens]|nr:hypothetical protein B7494_g103 [Chlorociboria aeruginascens]